MAGWKDNGPGGCCCASCWGWADDFADGVLSQHPGPTLNGVRWQSPNAAGAWSNEVVGLDGYLKSGRPPNTPEQGVHSLKALHMLTTIDSNSLIAQGFSVRAGHVGVYEFDLTVHSFGKCIVSADVDWGWVFDRGSGGLWMGLWNRRFPAGLRQFCPVGNLIPHDFSNETHVKIDIGPSLHSPPLSPFSTVTNHPVAISLDGVEVARGKWTSFVQPAPVAIEQTDLRFVQCRSYGVASISFNQPLDPEPFGLSGSQGFYQGGSSNIYDNHWTPTETIDSNGYEVRNMQFNATSAVAPPGQCEPGVTHWFVDFIDTGNVLLDVTGAAHSNSDGEITLGLLGAQSNQVWSGAFPGTPTGVTAQGNDYTAELLTAKLYMLPKLNQFRLDINARAKLQIIGASWFNVSFVLRVDFSSNYTFPIVFAEPDVIVGGESTTGFWAELFGDLWTITLSNG